MAQKVLVEMVDDISGETATQTVPFGLDGVEYTIDLSDVNAASLREELAPYIAAGRRTGGRKIRVATGEPVPSATTSANRERSRAIRDWAREHGHHVSERGRISAEIIKAYEEDQAPKPATPARGRGGRKKVAAAKK
ncbi:Lsr2 family protein [Amycolatopsis magusensis]|uniref:Lsr2 family protein n=1 Tax=Amycolatopsis magusensis TaxID=882444 RepID=UPI0037952A65